ncbi:Alpha-L-Rha alpha-1,2-L-rhamnosyltransferase/alpha-L-Rha alpha-1,3-L- rhamnosyltransferase [Azospirillum argentinense]|uniref:Polysaccharide biosynthesis-like protein n=2 Tax=Azospirillum TaxID=191 RepID=A0A2K1FVP1_9PROT|nr:Alpha-L-Rha alpha-1,2-L-rhamnosyltransferase/alpha-L-Rha alpha-1,3-L- rhamnosyltransferase [Azospirillum argentinense]PNQ96603.1 polysaccharide biosynthesis-like protein [Azospirillum argentinense]QCO07236.1 polysaccharide biosynthesis-like protein [Azospirillum argentinense]
MDFFSLLFHRGRSLVMWLIKQLHLVNAYISYFFSSLRKESYVRERWEGVIPLAGAKRLVVFVHYDRKGIVHDFARHYLRQLADSGFAIVFVSNAPTLGASEVDWLQRHCALILRRANVGYDFGAYKEGIAAIPDLATLDTLLLANDSVYGPLHHIAGVLERMEPETADVWGASDCWEFSFHLQSYFLVFHKPALQSPAFAEFWSKLRYVQSKTWIIMKYEVGLTRAMRQAGLRCRAAFPYRDAAAALIEAVVERDILSEGIDPVRKNFIQQVFRIINAGRPLNSTHFFWDYMIAQMDFPFLKRELLQKNPAHIPLLTYWERVVKQSTDYDTDLILRHLELSLKNRSV